MDIAKAFEILSQGEIVSSNCSQHSDLANMLLDEDFFNELDELVNKLGFNLVGSGGYFFISKRRKLTSTEQQNFITKHRDSIIGIAFLRQLYPRLDRGDTISFIEAVTSYVNIKRDDSTIKDKLVYFSWTKNKDDEKNMMEQLFKHLENKSIIEKINDNNADKFKVLDAVNYYLSIVESIEIGEEEC